MIVKNHSTGKYMVIRNTNRSHYYHNIILTKYNKNINIPNMNQVELIQNNLKLFYDKSKGKS